MTRISKDANGDNVYELVLQLRDYGSGTELGTTVELIVVVTDSQNDISPTLVGNGPDNDDYSFNVSEYQAPVANLTTVEKNGNSRILFCIW